MSTSLSAQAPSTLPAGLLSTRTENLGTENAFKIGRATRALQAARTQVLGLVVPDLTNALFTELMHGVEDGAAAPSQAPAPAPAKKKG